MQPKAEHAARIDKMIPTNNKQSKDRARVVGSGFRVIDTVDSSDSHKLAWKAVMDTWATLE